MTDKRAHRLIKRLDSAITIFEKITFVVICLMVLGIVAWVLSPMTGIFGEEVVEKIFTATMFFGCGMAVLFVLVCWVQSIFCGGFYLERLTSQYGKSVAVALNRRATCFRKMRTRHIFLENFPESRCLDTSHHETDFNIEIVRDVILQPDPFSCTERHSRTTSVTIYARYEFRDLRKTLTEMIEGRRLNLDELELQLEQTIHETWHGLKVWSTPFSEVPSDFLPALKLAVQEIIVPNTPPELVFRDYSWKYTHIELDD